MTTADERTWKFDRPVIFLGEWCRRYDRRHVWSTLDAVVAEPYGFGRASREADLAFVRAFEMDLNAAVGEELNRFHGTTHGSRFWRILLGHWLRRYVDVVFNRYRTLEQCFERYEISGTSVLVSGAYHSATQTSDAFIWACDDPVWDNVLWARVLPYVDGGSIPVEAVPVDEGPGFRPTSGQTPAGGYRRLKRWAFEFVDAATNLAVRDSDAFIIRSYLPHKEELKAQLRLGQVPKIWRSPALPLRGVPDPAARHELGRRLSRRSPDGVRRCINGLLFELLPTCYLEDFPILEQCAEQLQWPKRPRFVFTSNNSDTDEIFKYWAGTRAESGVPYYTGQHGNNYGTHRYLYPSIEESVSDGFLTWGWTDGRPEHIPAFIFTRAGGRTPSPDRKGGLLLVSQPLNHRICRWDVYAEFAEYFTEQQEFVRMLSPVCREGLTIRLHSAHRRLHWSEERRWLDFEPTLRLDAGGGPIHRSILKSRLVVFSYDSTGLLEGLAQNTPTMAFWQNGYEHLRDNAKPWYQRLADVGVIHLSPASVAEKVNSVWEEVRSWWYSREVQDAREAFCERYARMSNHPARDIVHLLTTRRPRDWAATSSR